MNPLLQRQLRRLGISRDRRPTEEEWRDFLDRVERTYTLADQDRYTLERSLSISSLEMQALYDDLRRSSETELARQRDQLRESFAILQSALEAAIEGVLVVSMEGRVVRHNDRFIEMWGLTGPIAEGASDADLRAAVQPLLVDPSGFVDRVQYLLDRPTACGRDELALLDGRVFERHSAPVMVGSSPVGRVWFFRDVSRDRHLESALQEANQTLEARVRERTSALERANLEIAQEYAERQRAEAALHHAEEQLRLAQKMEAIGRLAGGIAHDFNNMIAVVLQCASGLRELVHDPAALEEVEEIDQAAQRSAALTRQLLAFSRQERLRPERVDLTRTIRSMEKLLRRVLGGHVVLVVEGAGGPAPALLDQGQIDQAILNLVVNARDAMPLGGRITIAVHRATADDAQKMPDVALAPHFAVSVSDDGSGMSPDVLDRIFEPFFTTKAPGKGTGLGLATTYAMVRQSGGQITVDSAIGRGTTFTLYFPELERETMRPEKAAASDALLEATARP